MDIALQPGVRKVVVVLEGNPFGLEGLDGSIDIADDPGHGSGLVGAGELRFINEDCGASGLVPERSGLVGTGRLQAELAPVELPGCLEVLDPERCDCVLVSQHGATLLSAGIIAD